MPGNEVGDRVHNFFAEDNLSQGQPVFANDQWVGSQRQIGVQNFNPKNYNLQQSDNERGSSNSYFHVPNSLNFSQSTPRPEFTTSQSQSQQLNLYGNQFYQRRQDEANFLGVDTESDHQNIAPGGLSLYDSHQGSGSEHQTKMSIRSETSESPVSFDFFGSHQQMNHQQQGILHSLPRQQSGISDMQQLQQQIIFRKMQEIQRQQQFWQLDTQPQNLINQISPFDKQASIGQSPALTNGIPVSDALSYPCASEHATGSANWWQRGSPAMLGSPARGPISPPNHVQACLTGMVPQQVNQSPYGVPVSSSKGSLSECHYIAVEKSSVRQMPTFSNSFSGNQHTVFPDQVSMQNGSLSSRQDFQGENFYGHSSGQGLTGGMNMENLQQVNTLQRNESFQELQGRQQQAGRSETSQENPTIEAAVLQNSVALDPTEQKILFGSDDNIWDAFGVNTNMSRGAGNLGGAGFLNGFPSIQSGSWSALMQSAVAETSSSDIGLQEEWNALNFQNANVPSRNQLPLTYNNSGKYQISMADDSFQAATTLDTGSAPLMSDANMNNNNELGFQQFGHKFSHGLQTNNSRSPAQQSSEGSGKGLNQALLHKSLADGSQAHGKAHILDSETNGNSISSPRASMNVGSGKLGDKSIGLNVIRSVPRGGGASSNIHESENSQINGQRRTMHLEMGHADRVWKTNSVPNSTVELEHVNSSVGSLQVNKEGFSSSCAAVIPNSSCTGTNKETSDTLLNSQQLNYWNNVDSLVESKGIEGLAKSQHYLKKGTHDVESLNGYGLEEVGIHVKENCNKKENSNDSYHSNLSNSASAGGLRENVVSGANNSRNLPCGKQKSSNQVGRKISGRKFQYHPMGNVDEDVDPSYGMRQATHLQAMSPQNFRGFSIHDVGHSGHSKVFNQVPNTSTELEKRQSASLQGQTKDYGEAPPEGIHLGYVPNMSAPFKRSVGMYATGKTSQSRLNMLELVDSTDQSRESGGMVHISSSEPNSLLKVPVVENYDGSVCPLQQSQRSASRGFGLALGPPSQGLSVPNHSLSSQSFVQTVNSFSSNNVPAVIREKGHAQLAPTASGPSFPPSNKTSQVDKNNRTNVLGQAGTEASLDKMPGNFSLPFSSGFPFSKVQPQNQQNTGSNGEGSINHSINMSLNRHASDSKHINDSSCSKPLTGQSNGLFFSGAAGRSPCDNPASSGYVSKPSSTSHPCERVSCSQVSFEEAVPVSQPLSKSSVAQQSGLPKMLPNGPAQQQSPGPPAHSLNLPHSHESNIMESTSSVSQSLGVGGNVSSDFGISAMDLQSFGCGGEQMMFGGPSLQASSGKANELQRKENTIKHASDASPVNAVLTQRDMEAFGRSLKPNNHFQQNYFLLSQMQPTKNPVRDPGNTGLKRFKGSDGDLEGQQVAPLVGESSECNLMVGDAFIHHAAGPSGDSKMLSFPRFTDNSERNASQLGKASSQNNSYCDPTASVRVEQCQISPQMAPSWFNQYGTFKNGQMFPAYDARKASVVKPLEQPFALCNSSSSTHTLNSMEQLNAAVNSSEVGKVQISSTPATVAIEHFASSKSLPPDVSGHNLEVWRPKKRKSTTFKLHPWHKEVSLNSQHLQTISVIEVEWAQAMNRLAEKVEGHAEMIEDGLPLLRQKRRLTLTTQLMQQLFCPPPRVFLSTDASSSYESVVYSITRRTLGNACSMVCCSRSDSSVPCDTTNYLSDKWKTFERIDDHHISKDVEGLLGKARKLEIDFLRLDKRASVLDLKVEYQDLEKFSIINRFARFHGRGQADGAEVSSSSSDATANPHKPSPQRYVTALPLPRTLPDRVQCLSL